MPRRDWPAIERTLEFSFDCGMIEVRIWFKGDGPFPETTWNIDATLEGTDLSDHQERGERMVDWIAENVPNVAAVQARWPHGPASMPWGMKAGLVIYPEWP